MKRFVVCTMGGMVDSFWDEKQRKISPNRHTIILDVLHKNFNFLSRVRNPICMKDGRDIDAFDIHNLHTIVKECSHDYIMVVSGLVALSDIYDYLSIHGLYHNRIILWGAHTIWQKNNHIESLGFAIDCLRHGEYDSIFIVYEQQNYNAVEFRSLLFTQNIAL